MLEKGADDNQKVFIGHASVLMKRTDHLMEETCLDPKGCEESMVAG